MFRHKIPGYHQVCPGQNGHSQGYSADNFGTKMLTSKANNYKFAGAQNLKKIS